MTVGTTNNRKTYTADGSLTEFPFDYRLINASHLKVYIDDVIQVGGYSVDINSSGVGGTVTFSEAPGTTDEPVVVDLVRSIPKTQTTVFQNDEKINEETLENVFDKIVMLIQELDDSLDQVVGLPSTEGTTAGQVLVSNGPDDPPSFVDLWNTDMSAFRFTSPEHSLNELGVAANTITEAHSLGTVPSLTIVKFICTSADAGYAVGDTVFRNEYAGVHVYADVTNLYAKRSSTIQFPHKSTGVATLVDMSKWNVVLEAFL